MSPQPGAARPFALQDVRLLPGPFHEAQQAHGLRLLAVLPDALLHPFRLRAGLPTRGPARRGAAAPTEAWDLGPYLSACGAMWAATSNPAFRLRVAHLADGLQQCRERLDDASLGAACEMAAHALQEAGAPAAAPGAAAGARDTDDPARYGELLYRHDGHILYVDRFIASVLHWPAMGLRLRQLANCPEQGAARMLVQAVERTRLLLRLRQPGWCPRALVHVNGRQCAEGRQPGAFIEVDRPWRRGDEIVVELPLHAPAPQHRPLLLLQPD